MNKIVKLVGIILIICVTVVVRNKVYAPEVGRPVEAGKEIENAPKEVTKENAEELARKSKDQLDLIDERSKELSAKLVTFNNQRRTFKEMPPDLEKQISDVFDEMVKVERSKKEWTEIQQNKLVQTATSKLVSEQQLAPVGQKPLGETLREGILNRWKNFSNQLRATWQKTKLWFQENLFKNVESAIKIRNDLSKVYTDMGRGGLLDKARNDAQIAFMYDELSDRFASHLAALQDYKNAMDAGVFTIGDKDTDQLYETISDLLVSRINLDRVDPVTATRMKKSIDQVLNDLGISAADRVQLEIKLMGIKTMAPEVEQFMRDLMRRRVLSNQKEQQQLTSDINAIAQSAEYSPADIARLQSQVYEPPKTSQEATALATKIREDARRITDLITEQPLRVQRNTEFQNLIANLEVVHSFDLSNLSLIDQVHLLMSVHDAFEQINARTLEYIEKTGNQSNVQDAVAVINRLIINPNRQSAEKLFQEGLARYYSSKELVRAPTKEELANQQPLPKDFVKTMVNQLDKPVKEFFDSYNNNSATVRAGSDLDTKYNDLMAEIDATVRKINSSPVSIESLQARQWILDNVYNPLVNAAYEVYPYLPEKSEPLQWNIERFVDMAARKNKFARDLEMDRSILIAIKEGLPNEQPVTIEVVEAHARPFTDANDPKRKEYSDSLYEYLTVQQVDDMLDEMKQGTRDKNDIKKLLNKFTGRQIDKILAEQKAGIWQLSQNDIDALNARQKLVEGVSSALEGVPGVRVIMTKDRAQQLENKDQLLAEIKMAPVTLRHVEQIPRNTFLDQLKAEGFAVKQMQP